MKVGDLVHYLDVFLEPPRVKHDEAGIIVEKTASGRFKVIWFDSDWYGKPSVELPTCLRVFSES